MRPHIAVILCVTMLLGACDKSAPTPPPVPKLFEEQRDALDKAKDVSAMQLEAAEQQRKAMEQQTQ